MLGRRGIAAVWFSLFHLVTWGCGATNDSQYSDLLWHTGAGTLRGHEDITRFAVEIANQRLSGRQDIGYEPVPYGVHGPISFHPLIKGNFESDFPPPEMRQVYGATPATDWHHDGRLQHLHALRNYRDGSTTTNGETCQAVKFALEQALKRATAHLQSGDRYHYHYWIGHALHILQDSYSPAHVTRVGPEGHSILAFCTYGVKLKDICYHHEVDARDRVWRGDSLRCTFDSDRRDWDCLVPEAQHAAIASAELLAALSQRQVSGEPLESTLSRVWDRHLNCAGL
ncbi:MAG: hypothetical protein FJ146_06955 [Deltaproteobacteria bacterium]|nr:hypothetical protein [Deltaproteobacteria bacterium]